MGGEHKCPVCQSTFTRPQHVARHMRSHTGDRPYKCQFCGDQFARSDLLARHVNKCHASEKTLLPSTGARRKGSATTSRATTSKQACDQCVQNSLPCDGANPCAKCNQRKIRCTFVKFHRQTAPLGPGHNPPPVEVLPPSTPTSTVSASRHPSFSASRDDFHLGLPPTTVPSMAESIFSDGFVFPPIYPDNAHTQPVSEGETSDFSSRYRARADLLRRTGEHVDIDTSGSMNTHPYSDPRHGWGGPVPTGAGSTWNDPRFREEKTHRQQQLRPYPPSDLSTVYRHLMQRPNSEYDLDLEFSDGSGNSIPSSSTGSEVNLPLSTASAPATGAFISSDPTFSQSALADPTAPPFPSQVPFHPSSSFPNTTNILQSSSARVPAPPKLKDTFDESAFGSLSIDDPALLAADNPPFFSDVLAISSSTPRTAVDDPIATPMPPRPASGTDGDPGDLWRAFMRSTPVGEQPHRRASVPATNVAQPGNTYTHEKRPSTLHPPFHQPRYAAHAALHTQQPDDLLRYQQAVLARARENETVLRPPPDARPKPRRSTVDTEHGPPLAISRRRGSRPGSPGSSASAGTSRSTSSLVGDGAGLGMKRGLSSAMRGPESKRRVVGDEG